MIKAPPPPSVRLFIGEGLGVALQVFRLLLHTPRLARQTRSGGEAVLVFPGYGTGDRATAVLRAYLRWLGCRASGWGLGTNRGNINKLTPKVVELVEREFAACGTKLHLIGWSLGGVLAREAARERPDLVRQVITLGSPVAGGPKYTTTADSYQRRGIDLDLLEAQVAERNQEPLRVPVTSIYTRTDRVVAWEACVDPWNTEVEHIEVRGAHSGLGFSPDVFALVAERLATPADAPWDPDTR